VEPLNDKILKVFDEQRKALQAKLADIDRKETEVLRVLEVNGRPLQQRPPSVPDDKYEAIKDFLRRNPDSRQTDIAAGSGINSGIVSTAMKIALGRQEVEADRRGRGAHYKLVDNRETAVHDRSGFASGEARR
jgi:hypothetical protein